MSEIEVQQPPLSHHLNILVIKAKQKRAWCTSIELLEMDIRYQLIRITKWFSISISLMYIIVLKYKHIWSFIFISVTWKQWMNYIYYMSDQWIWHVLYNFKDTYHKVRVFLNIYICSESSAYRLKCFKYENFYITNYS